jgi:ABC-type transporter MlaC component
MAGVMVIDACGKIGFMLSLRQKMAGGNKGGRRVVDMAISGVWLGSSVGSGSKRARNVLD